jgi:hypothetical protein
MVLIVDDGGLEVASHSRSPLAGEPNFLLENLVGGFLFTSSLVSALLPICPPTNIMKNDVGSPARGERELGAIAIHPREITAC